jgi:hypothetical protein
MTELKTLKDLTDEGYGSVILYCKQELKQEAIKWVKERKFLPVPKGVEPHVYHAYMHGEREFIKHFFNLTEEDLK